MIRTGLRTSRPKPMEMPNGRRVCDTCLMTPTRMSATYRKPSSALCVVRNLATRTACVSLRRAMNPVAASRRISPKLASGVQRHWESFDHRKEILKMKKNKKLLIGIGIVAVLCVTFFHIYTSRVSDTGEVIKIGVIAYLTGPVSQIGNEYLQGIQLGLDRFNTETNDLKIRLCVEDGKNSPKDAVSTFNKLRAEGVSAILIVGDNHVNPVAPLAVKYKLPILASIAGSTEFLNYNVNSDVYIFLDWITINQISRALAMYAHDTKEIHSVGMLTLEDEYGREASRVFKSAYQDTSHRIVSSESFPYESKDISVQVAKIVTQNPDAIFIAGYGGAYINSINKIRESGYKGIILTDTSIMNPESKQGVVDTSNIIYADSVYNDYESNGSKVIFLQSYKNIFAKEPSLFAAFGFDCFTILARVCRDVHDGSSPNMTQGILLSKGFNTLNGSIVFSGNGAASLPLVLRKLDQFGSSVKISTSADKK